MRICEGAENESILEGNPNAGFFKSEHSKINRGEALEGTK